MVPFVSFHNKASENNKIKIYLELQKARNTLMLFLFRVKKIYLARIVFYLTMRFDLSITEQRVVSLKFIECQQSQNHTKNF